MSKKVDAQKLMSRLRDRATARAVLLEDVEVVVNDLPDEAGDAAVAAIAYVLDMRTECPMEFLRCWNQGDFDVIRNEWPDAPEAVFAGADPLYKPA
jgi:hypothetical protein